MVEFLAGTVVLFAAIFSIVQLLLLWAGQGAVETAAHFAARKFAFNARTDYRGARTAALAEASSLCRNRPGGTRESAAITSLDISRDGTDSSVPSAVAGEAYRIRITHGVELIVPWIDRLLFSIAPVPKMKIDGRYYFLLNATRWATVE